MKSKTIIKPGIDINQELKDAKFLFKMIEWDCLWPKYPEFTLSVGLAVRELELIKKDMGRRVRASDVYGDPEDYR